ncbi:MAG: hypothetical protein WA584_08355 [Pyrinomonadaceae bacterium]
MMKIKNAGQLKQVVPTFLLILALGLSIAAQTNGGTDGNDRSGQIIGSGSRASQTVGSGGRSSSQVMGSGGYTEGGLIGSGTATASPDSGSRGIIEDVWNWFESIL